MKTVRVKTRIPGLGGVFHLRRKGPDCFKLYERVKLRRHGKYVGYGVVILIEEAVSTRNFFKPAVERWYNYFIEVTSFGGGWNCPDPAPALIPEYLKSGATHSQGDCYVYV